MKVQTEERGKMGTDFRPAPPEEAYFDSVHDAWILSRYSDVYAALREPTLHQVSAQGDILLAESEGSRHAQLFAGVQADMARMSSAEWHVQIETTVRELIGRSAFGQPIDIVRGVIQPWSSAVLVALSGAKPPHAKRLKNIADRLFYPCTRGDRGARSPFTYLSRQWCSWCRRRAAAGLSRMLDNRELSLSSSTFAGLTQTLPSFLAKAWFVLLQHPDQAAVLLAGPELMPGAVEELLRYAGIVHTLYRRASSDISIGDIRIARGERVTLKLGSANYDPAKFDEPHRLDITRRAAGHLGLGTGAHACVGTALVRMATAVITPIFLAASPTLEANKPIVWTGDTTLRWPLVVTARFRTRDPFPKV